MKTISIARRALAALAAATLAAAAPVASAQMHIGVVVSLTGPAASLGIPEQQSVELWGDRIAGQPVKFTVLNDSTDTTGAANAARRLIQENNVDIVIGPSLTPTSLAVLPVIAENKVPMISLAGGGAIVEPMDDTRKWSFKLTPTETISMDLIFGHMKKNGHKTLGVIALSNAYGDGYLKVLEKFAPERGIQVVATERYGLNDQSVVAQTLKLVAAKPDAVFVIASGTPGALPQVTLVQRGYKGPIYQTQGVANNDFLRVGGKDLEGGYMAVAPVLVASQLPESNPIRKPAMAYVEKFEAKHGTGSLSLFGGTAWDALKLIEAAVPGAMKAAKPGTPEFRAALRDGLERLQNVVAAEAVYTMSPTNHNGVDARSQVLVRIENGKWKLVQ